MKRVRITYPGAFHHVMNRGFGGNEIFFEKETKSQFLDYLQELSLKMKIRIIAYVIMDTHYHLILENTSGKLSDCMKLLNGQYGMYYRKKYGGKGYVFQSRFKSTLIENESYLIQSILYLFNNPVRAGLVEKAEDYIWSSLNYYFSEKETKMVDAAFIENLFNTKGALLSDIRSTANRELALNVTKYGEYLGSEEFFKSAMKKHDRRTGPTDQSIGTQRKDEGYFDPVEKIFIEFESMNDVVIEEIDTGTFEGKRLRSDLLVHLKERAGLTYREIGELELFQDLRISSMGAIYRNMKKRKVRKD